MQHQSGLFIAHLALPNLAAAAESARQGVYSHGDRREAFVAENRGIELRSAGLIRVSQRSPRRARPRSTGLLRCHYRAAAIRSALVEAGCIRRRGKLFVHIFAHRTLMYPFETAGSDNWLGRYYFTGGLMPSADTLLWFQRDLRIEERWKIDGTHYQRTANAWLARQDANRDEILCVLQQAYGTATAALWLQRWRMFWMACAELFGYGQGQQWLVAHYRFARLD